MAFSEIIHSITPQKKFTPTPCRIKRQILQRMSEILKASSKQKQRAKEKFREKKFHKKMISTGIVHSITVKENTFVRVNVVKQCLPNPAKFVSNLFSNG